MSLLQKKSSGAARFMAGSLILALLATLSACSIKPFRIDIQQGNVVSAEQFAQLREGMSRDQVRFLLGTPLLTDVFHESRWDYHYRMLKGNTEELSSRSLSVYFNAAGKVEKIEADEAFRALKAEEGSGNKVYDLSTPVKP